MPTSTFRPSHRHVVQRLAALTVCGVAAACSSAAAPEEESIARRGDELVSNQPSFPAPGDYDGDGRADISMRNGNGQWLIDFAANGYGVWDKVFGGYGGSESIPVPADYDGDHKTDLSVKDKYGNWYIDYASNGFGGWDRTCSGYGDNSGIPVPADYDGDGKADIAVKGSDASWYIDYLGDGGCSSWNAIIRPDSDGSGIPAPADFDGDGKADLSIKRNDGRWYFDYSRDGFHSSYWDRVLSAYGDNSAQPVPADYDGDHRADLAVKGNDGVWYIDYAYDGVGGWNTSYAGYGGSWSTAAPADYDGDGRADLSMKDSTSWYIDYRSTDFGSLDRIVNVTEAVPSIPSCEVDGACKLAIPALDTGYYLQLWNSGFHCQTPGTYLNEVPDPQTMYFERMNYTLCPDSQGLRDKVSRDSDAKTPTKIINAFLQDRCSVSNPCLTPPPVGYVYVFYTAYIAGSPFRCTNTCMMPPGI